MNIIPKLFLSSTFFFIIFSQAYAASGINSISPITFPLNYLNRFQAEPKAVEEYEIKEATSTLQTSVTKESEINNSATQSQAPNLNSIPFETLKTHDTESDLKKIIDSFQDLLLQ